jgi:valyl-tRNA synthetase
MSTELAKAYDPKAVQTEVQAAWDAAKCWHAEPTDPGEPYSIVIPPPNVTAALHLGHALNNTLQDILVRRARMQGKNTCWLPGTDHAGIATQTVVEKRVLKEEGKRRTDFSRDEFVAKIQAWKDEYEKTILGQLKAMGCSCDWDRTAFTMDEPRAKAVREAFFQLFKAGLIYRGKRLVNWDPVTQTALADDEVEMEEVDGNFYDLRYPIVGGGAADFVTVATTRPETMLGDTAVAINPKDPRAAQLRGKKLKLPIVDREIPIIEDDYVVLPASLGGDPADPKSQFATGFLKVTPAHDPNDYDIGQRHSLAVINVMGPDASISLDHGWAALEPDQKNNAALKPLLGLSREAARKAVVQWFKQAGLLEEIKPYRHSVGHSYRSHVPIEPWLSDQWYCRVTDPRLAGRALEVMNPSQKDGGTGYQPVSAARQPNPPAADQGQVAPATTDGLTFYPARYAKTFQTWHENIRDWCISRQLWWGHRIPVWTNRNGLDAGYRKTFGSSPEGQQINEHFGDLLRLAAVGRIALIKPADGWPLEGLFICPKDEDDEEVMKLLLDWGYEQDPDVLDTWFSSGLWPLSTLGWPDQSADSNQQSALEKWNPTNVLCTAREIITLWVSRMVMFNEFLRGCLPFKDVFIHAMIQDGHGQKMSKSLGNGVDPLDIIDTHGADAMRFTLASMATNTQDVRMPVDAVDPFTGETFTPAFATTPDGFKVAAPVQERNGKQFASSYAAITGQAQGLTVAKNTSSKFDLGRNFCNKLWNAARFVLMQLGEAGASAAEPVDELKWTMADRWIVSRFNRTVAECDEAIANYRFDQYAKAAYDFFWRDFCDWYVECAKVQIKADATREQTRHVLAATLDGALRLLHPAIPFVTEKLWWRLNEIRPTRGLPGRIACPQPGDGKRYQSIMLAPWPAVGDVSQASEFIFPKIQEIVTAIRTLRNDYKVEPRRTVTVSIKAPGDAPRQIELLKGQIETLTNSTLKAVGPDVAEPASSAKASAAGAEIYVEGLVDTSAEQQRVAKRKAELTKEIEAMQKRLGNEGYIAKAPPKLVEETKAKLAAAEAELARLSGS